MAVKQFDLPDIGQVFVYKRAGVRNLRLTIRSDGSIRVTIPAWSPYTTGVNFARSRAEWIQKHATAAPANLLHEQAIGKSHRLYFRASPVVDKPQTRIRQSEIIVTYPSSMAYADEEVQR